MSVTAMVNFDKIRTSKDAVVIARMTDHQDLMGRSYILEVFDDLTIRLEVGDEQGEVHFNFYHGRDYPSNWFRYVYQNRECECVETGEIDNELMEAISKEGLIRGCSKFAVELMCPYRK